ncbi:MAG TPA: 2-octaprenyl-6-methoxyphenyl hydroxylase [Rudaea sp.]|nr:2-octaprenyl-6-methoxyphenyl hydroxylase [Rudaea sp.]
MKTDLDVLIVGGGLVGSSLAIALHGCGLRTGLVESEAPRAPAARAEPAHRDERNLALSRASVNALTALGVWAHAAERATPIRRIHVSRQGEFGAVRLDAGEHGVDAFGAVLPASELGRALALRLADCRELVRHAPATLTALAPAGEAVRVRLRTPQGEAEFATRLLVGADGTASFVRTSLGIQTHNVDYAQTAFVATIAPERADGCAYERFTATGPLALLPLPDRRAGVVLTVPSADAERVAALDDAAFAELVQQRFGWRLGRLSRPGRRFAHALKRVEAERLVAQRAVLVGNAAQTLHPIAAQGFNLGLRDALTLHEMLVDRGCDDPGDPDLLADYAARRASDRAGTIAMSDALARYTAGEAAPLKLARSIGLIALDRLPPLKHALVRRGMGFRGTTPRLALEGLR